MDRATIAMLGRKVLQVRLQDHKVHPESLGIGV